MNDFYILDDKTPIPVDAQIWVEWFNIADRHVAKTTVGPYWISTVFMGIDHGWGKGPPVLFETMAFKGKSGKSYAERRWHTWAEAEAGHAEMVTEFTNRLVTAKKIRHKRIQKSIAKRGY